MLIQGTVPDTVGPRPGRRDQSGAGAPGTLRPDLGAGRLPGHLRCRSSTYFRGANTTQYGGKSSISMEGADRLGEHRQGRGRGGAGGQRRARRDPPRSPCGPTRRARSSSRPPSGSSQATRAAVGAPDPAPTRAPRASTSGRPTSAGAGSTSAPPSSLARRGQDPAGGGDRLARLVRAADRVERRDRRPRAGPLRHRRPASTGSSSGAPARRRRRGTRSASGDSTGDRHDFGSIDLNARPQRARDLHAARRPRRPDLRRPASPTPSSTSSRSAWWSTARRSRRRASTAACSPRLEDPSLRGGFPKRLGTGGEAPIRYADLNGDNEQELIVPTEDGDDPRLRADGSELPGWPVHTRTQIAGRRPRLGARASRRSRPATPPREPPRGAVVADLDGDGAPEVDRHARAPTSTPGSPTASRVPGFPVSSNLSFCGAAAREPAAAPPQVRLPRRAPPSATSRGRTSPSTSSCPALDGHLYAFDGHGNAAARLPGRARRPERAAATSR